MGFKPWDASKWAAVDTDVISKARVVTDVYRETKMNDLYNPLKIGIRESCDSVAHPNSNAIIFGLDVTGSMGRILMQVARRLGELMALIIERKPVADPHIMAMAIGDTTCDTAPLQVTQFETDIKIAEQLMGLWFEHGGGGNDFESYPLAWYFAATRTKTDCFDKRGQKGIIFTMGDDCFPDSISARDISKFLGTTVERDIKTEEIVEMVNRRYHLFHFMLEQGGSASDINQSAWKRLLGGNAIPVNDYEKIPEIVVSTLEKLSGKSTKAILGSWDKSTALVVGKAIEGIQISKGASSGFVTF